MKRATVAICGCLAAGLVATEALSNGGAANADGGIQISPQTLILGGSGCDAVTVHTIIPYYVAPGSVQLGSVTAAYTFLDDRGELVAKFSREAIEGIVSPGSVTLTLFVNGTAVGSDTIMVKE